MLKIKDELNNIFEIVLKVPSKKNKINLNYINVKKWDSLNHVKLILQLESKFKIKISAIDSLKLISYKNILNYLNKKK
jgi:acyl carrier protein